jgi:hypothetical protein
LGADLEKSTSNGAAIDLSFAQALRLASKRSAGSRPR